jgi:hypothetical protein
MDFLEDEFTWTWLGVAAIAAFLMAVFLFDEYGKRRIPITDD